MKLEISNTDSSSFVIKTTGFHRDNVVYHWDGETKYFWAHYPPVLTNIDYDTSSKEMLNYVERETIVQVIDYIFKRDNQNRENHRQSLLDPPLLKREYTADMRETEDCAVILDSRRPQE